MGVIVGVIVGVEVLVTVGVMVDVLEGVIVGVGVEVEFVQEGNLKEPIRVRQAEPVVCWYSVVYQNVQSSTGSIVIML